jgi:hypothetical protein
VAACPAVNLCAFKYMNSSLHLDTHTHTHTHTHTCEKNTQQSQDKNLFHFEHKFGM